MPGLQTPGLPPAFTICGIPMVTRILGWGTGWRSSMNRYIAALTEAMTWVAQQPGTLFVGQSVAYPGTFMVPTLAQVPMTQRLELPVCERFQLQFTLGLALAGYTPISIYPRQNFLFLALSELVHVLDVLPQLSQGTSHPRLLIRTASGPSVPVHPGPQHVGHYAAIFRQLCTSIRVVDLSTPEMILPAYHAALTDEPAAITLLLENGNAYALP